MANCCMRKQSAHREVKLLGVAADSSLLNELDLKCALRANQKEEEGKEEEGSEQDQNGRKLQISMSLKTTNDKFNTM